MELTIIIVLAIYAGIISYMYFRPSRINANEIKLPGWTLAGEKRKDSPSLRHRIIRNGSDTIELIKEQIYE